MSALQCALVQNEKEPTNLARYPTRRVQPSVRAVLENLKLEKRFQRTIASLEKQKFVQARSVARDLNPKSRADALMAKVNESTSK